MTTEQAEIRQDPAVAQQVHHAEHPVGHTPRPESLPVAATAAVKPDADPSGLLRTMGKAIGCVLRPFPIDDADPRGSRRRVALIVAGVVAAVAGLVFVVMRAR